MVFTWRCLVKRGTRYGITATLSLPVFNFLWLGLAACQPVSGNRAECWQKSKDAAKAVLDLTNYGSQLNLSAPATPAAGTENYMNIALARNGGEKNLIFTRSFINGKQEDGGQRGLFNGPNGYHNWAGNTPVSLLIDDYEMTHQL